MSDLPVALPAEVDLRAMPVLALKDWLEDVVGDTAYNLERDRLAKLVDRSPRTLDNWRSRVENRAGFAPSSPRAAGKRKAKQQRESDELRGKRVQTADQPKVDNVVDNSVVEARAVERAAGPPGVSALDRWKAATRELKSDLGAKAAAKILRQIADQMDPAKPAARASSGNGQSTGPCMHPVNRRIGSDCGECGASVKAAR